MRMKRLYTLTQELNVMMENGEITMDDAVEEMLCEFDIASETAYEVLYEVMEMASEA